MAQQIDASHKNDFGNMAQQIDTLQEELVSKSLLQAKAIELLESVVAGKDKGSVSSAGDVGKLNLV